MAKTGATKKKTSRVSKSRPKASAGARKAQPTKVVPPPVRPARPLVGSFRLTYQTFGLLKRFWRPLGGILLVYALLNIVLASGLSNISLTVGNLQASPEDSISLSAGLRDFSKLLNSGSTAASQTGSLMQLILLILGSLAIIWALRNLLAGGEIGVKQAYYQAMAPLVPFLLVLAFMFVQLLPLGVGAAIFATLVSAAAGPVVETIAVVTFIALAAWTLYMLSTTVFALYIVTLPDMTPRQALRSAKNLVHHHRWPIIRRLLFLPLFLLAAMAVIVVPFIIFLAPLVSAVFFSLSALSLLFAHVYMYGLYRDLLS